ncbi:coth-domain-containing protein [Anaeromyces robustus]|jgi:spore coat protein CotH|uniref:Coth-domain-containing protein n=1 Tax=Anaeromyces robustus TaxID=1754192 RepID=A0A1Y1VR69_9FUNG|nr:coth-domain-containing protein [Anaeromyces robustus]|eukprot:ORX63767.1 coth-domain-containing protein [Anaeromyces robustus]
MKSFLFSLIIVLTYIVNTSLAVSFKVLCSVEDYQGSGMTVYIDGNPQPMTKSGNGILYVLDYQGTPNQYYYEVTGTALNELTMFGTPRTWDSGSTTTFYEVFGRFRTIGDDILQTIPRLYPPLPGYDKYSQLFQEGELAVINVRMTDSDYINLTSLTSNTEPSFIVEFDLYTPYEEFHFTNATFKLSGQGSRGQEKKPYKLDLTPDESDKSNSEIYNRKEFKLRSLRFDESGIKNKIAGDIAESLGLPITQAAPCRLYINNHPYGLYELADMYKKKFVRTFFNVESNTDGKVYGSLYKGVSGKYPAYLYTDFGTETVQRLYESVIAPTAGYDPHQDINNMMTWLANLPDNASKEEIEKQFDIDMFLKYMIIEYLVCQWDGYIGNGNNFLIYIEPNNGKYHFFSYDFDITFGKWCKSSTGSFDEFITNVKPNGTYGGEPKREPLLYSKIIKNPNIKPMFEDLIKEIVGNLFNMEALEPRINYFAEFLKPDLYWDIESYQYIQTKTFSNADQQNLPTKEVVDAQFDKMANPENLLAFIKARSENTAQVYGITNLQAKGKYGTVGGKIMSFKVSADKN